MLYYYYLETNAIIKFNVSESEGTLYFKVR
jgi:hypothetical protein